VQNLIKELHEIFLLFASMRKFLFSFMFGHGFTSDVKRKTTNVEVKSIGGYKGVAITWEPKAFFRRSKLGKVQNFPVYMKLDQ